MKQREVDDEQKYLTKMNKKYEEKMKFKKAKWKEQSKQFREAMRAAREGKAAPVTVDTTLVPCKHCGRSFNENAAEKHIPFCAKKAKENKLRIGSTKKKR
jgi:rubrerythrin